MDLKLDGRIPALASPDPLRRDSVPNLNDIADPHDAAWSCLGDYLPHLLDPAHSITEFQEKQLVMVLHASRDGEYVDLGQAGCDVRLLNAFLRAPRELQYGVFHLLLVFAAQGCVVAPGPMQ